MPAAGDDWPILEARQGIAFTAHAGGFAEIGLCCPFCGDDYVHLEGQGDSPYDGHDGYWYLSAFCECHGHRWMMVFNEHKGQVFVTTKRLPDGVREP